MAEKILHSFEAGRRGKPDELDAALAHLVGAEFLKIDQNARFDVRVHGKWQNGGPSIFVSGEVSNNVLNTHNLGKRLDKIIKGHYLQVTHDEKPVEIDYAFKLQEKALTRNNGAGDSGTSIAVAYRNGPQFLPFERYLALSIRNVLDDAFRNPGNLGSLVLFDEDRNRIPDSEKFGYSLGPDGKVSVEVRYNGPVPFDVPSVTVSVQHTPDITLAKLRSQVNNIISKITFEQFQKDFSVIGYRQLFNLKSVIVNGNGEWHKGGWEVDEGNREAKPYRDGFGSYGCCEDSPWGEDPSKPSLTGLLLARYIAVQVVNNFYVGSARVALTYTIGRKSVGLNITTDLDRRAKRDISQPGLERWIHDHIPLDISSAAKKFSLYKPSTYREVALASDLFLNGATLFPWEKVNYGI